MAHAKAPDLLTDPVAGRSVLPHLIRSGIFLLVLLFFAALWAAGLSFTVLSSSPVLGAGSLGVNPQTGLLLSVVGLAGMLVVVFAWLFTLFLPVREYLAEGGMLLTGQAGRADAARQRVLAGTVDRWDRFPAEEHELSDGHAVTVATGSAQATLTIRVLGDDLFIGWVMWRSRSTLRVLLQIFGELLDGVGGDADIRVAGATSNLALRDLLRGLVEAEAAVAP